MGNRHQPFHQKYRPSNLDELIGQEVISLTLKQALSNNKIAPAYLFCGVRGTGKTSTARIFSKSLNCLEFDKPYFLPCNNCELCKNISRGIALDIIEIDAASNTGVENIREIIERSNFAPTQARWKVYVIDECHMLSTAASNALLKTIEEPPERVVFILATTNPERVLKTIQSRCQKFDFKRINSQQIFRHLVYIANKENIKFEDSALRLIAKRANGGMRDAQSLLDQLSLIPDGITKKNVEELLGEVSATDLINLLKSIINNQPEILIHCCSNLYDSGSEPIAILEGLLNITRDLLLKTVNNEYSDLFYTSEDFHPVLTELSKQINKSKIIKWHSALKNLEYQIKNSSQPRLWLEINLTSLIQIQDEIEKTEVKVLNKSKTKNITIDNSDFEEKIKLKNFSRSLNESIKSDIDIKKKNTLQIKENIENKQERLKELNTSEKLNLEDDKSINLKEKWSLILTKLELPSTRMLLSQQAELLSIQPNFVEIGLSPNWESMIKSRKLVIENSVKKIFGDHMSIQFTSKNIVGKKNDSSKNKKSNDSQNIDNNYIKEPNREAEKRNIEASSSKNLADFFNGEIIKEEE